MNLIDIINDILDIAVKTRIKYKNYKIRKDIINRKLTYPNIKNPDPLMRDIKSATEYLHNGDLYFNNEFTLAVQTETESILIKNVLMDYKKHPNNFYYNYRFDLLKKKISNTKYNVILNKYLLLL